MMLPERASSPFWTVDTASTHASPLLSMSLRRPSDWRSSFSAARKSSQPPSVTVVFAEPERSPPSASAAVRLTRKMSMQSIQSRKRDRDGDSVFSVQVEGGAAIDTGAEESVRDEYAEKRQQSIENSPVTEAEDQTANGEARQRRASWLSLRGSSSKQALNVSNTSLAAAESPDSRGPRVEVTSERSNTAAETATPSTPIPIDKRPDAESLNSNNSPSLGWFGSLSKRQPNALADDRQGPELSPERNIQPVTPQRSVWFTPQSPPNSDAQSMPSGPSSLGDQESTGASSPPLAAATPMPELVSSQTSEIKLSALNPSTSRFTLSMPLLGRPKVPLDKSILKIGDQSEVSVASSRPRTLSRIRVFYAMGQLILL